MESEIVGTEKRDRRAPVPARHFGDKTQMEPKTENLKKAIEELAAKAKNSSAPHEAMQFAQAALNLAHASATLHNMK